MYFINPTTSAISACTFLDVSHVHIWSVRVKNDLGWNPVCQLVSWDIWHKSLTCTYCFSALFVDILFFNEAQLPVPGFEQSNNRDLLSSLTISPLHFNLLWTQYHKHISHTLQIWDTADMVLQNHSVKNYKSVLDCSLPAVWVLLV